ncbi:MAG: hypothetical protein MJ014_00170 [Methanocorpusculum sp.]|nr:hypothetical protein [Methanocorpusculum sp.]
MVDPRYIGAPQAIPQETVLDDPRMRNAVPAEIMLANSHAYISNRVIQEWRHTNVFYGLAPKIPMTDPIHRDKASLIYRFLRDPNAGNSGTGARRPFNSTISATYFGMESVSTSIANLATAVVIDKDEMLFGGSETQWAAQVARARKDIEVVFNEMVIRGDPTAPDVKTDKARGPGSFAGLDKIVREAGWHVWPDTIDLTGLGSTLALDDRGDRQTTALWMDVAQTLFFRIRKLNPKPTWILGNDDLINALTALGQRLQTYWIQTISVSDMKDAPVVTYQVPMLEDIMLISLGKRASETGVDVIPSYTSNLRTRENPGKKGNSTYETKAYVGSFGEDGVALLTLPNHEFVFHGPIDVNDGFGQRWNMEMFIGMVVHSRDSVGMFEHIALPKHVFEYADRVDPLPTTV